MNTQNEIRTLPTQAAEEHDREYRKTYAKAKKAKEDGLLFCVKCGKQLVVTGEGSSWLEDTNCEYICRKCALDIWKLKCGECGCIFYDDPDMPHTCPNCEEEEHYCKATKLDVLKCFYRIKIKKR